MIDDTFPVLKFWNLFDKTNIEKYNKIQEKGNTSSGIPQTLG